MPYMYCYSILLAGAKQKYKHDDRPNEKKNFIQMKYIWFYIVYILIDK